MFAQVASFENIDLDLVEEVTEWNKREAWPQAQTVEGFQGSLVLLNRNERTIRSIALFETEEQLEAAQPRFEEIRTQVPAELRERVEASGRRGPFLETCEVLLMEGFTA